MEKTCNVCYINLDIENSVKTSCNHYYCSSCFFRWLLTNNTCPVCRNDFCNRSINREEMENYSLELIEILLKGEEISTRNIELIKKNRDLLLEKSQSKELLETYKDLQKKELELLSRMGKEIESSREKIIENRRQLRIIKIRKINLKRKKLQLSGILQL